MRSFLNELIQQVEVLSMTEILTQILVAAALGFDKAIVLAFTPLNVPSSSPSNPSISLNEKLTEDITYIDCELNIFGNFFNLLCAKEKDSTRSEEHTSELQSH